MLRVWCSISLKVTLQYLLKWMFCYIGMKLSMFLLDVFCFWDSFSICSIPVQPSAKWSAQQKFVPDGLSYLLGGYAVVRAVALNNLQVQHLIKQIVFSLHIFIIAIFQMPKVQFIFWKRHHKYKLQRNFLLFVNVTCFIAEEKYQTLHRILNLVLLRENDPSSLCRKHYITKGWKQRAPRDWDRQTSLLSQEMGEALLEIIIQTFCAVKEMSPDSTSYWFPVVN